MSNGEETKKPVGQEKEEGKAERKQTGERKSKKRRRKTNFLFFFNIW